MPDPTPTPAPEPSGAVGMRPMVVSEEEAAELRRMAAENTAPPKIEPKRVAGGTPAPEDGARLAEIRQREQRATPGPWFDNSYSGIFSEPLTAETIALTGDVFDEADVASVPASHGDTATGRHAADMEFIAHAREDIPWLLDRIAALEAEVAAERRLNAQHQEALEQAERERDEARAMLDAMDPALQVTRIDSLLLNRKHTLDDYQRGVLRVVRAALGRTAG